MTPAPQAAAPPEWLRALGEWLHRVFQPVWRFFGRLFHFLPDAPYAKIFLWTVLALAAAAVARIVYQRLRDGKWRMPGRRRTRGSALLPETDNWALGAAPIHAWLREADALAASGQFAEAVHHLLFRSVEDIERRRPQVVRPSRTSRELAEDAAIPAAARDLFARIARLVERSLFGGRPVNADDWKGARAAYAEFALAGAWRA